MAGLQILNQKTSENDERDRLIQRVNTILSEPTWEDIAVLLKKIHPFSEEEFGMVRQVYEVDNKEAVEQIIIDIIDRLEKPVVRHPGVSFGGFLCLVVAGMIFYQFI